MLCTSKILTLVLCTLKNRFLQKETDCFAVCSPQEQKEGTRFYQAPLEHFPGCTDASIILTFEEKLLQRKFYNV